MITEEDETETVNEQEGDIQEITENSDEQEEEISGIHSNHRNS
ncbi:MAG: hypothetical protein R2741_03800 [Methanolobus sp.]